MEGSDGAIREVRRLVDEQPDRYFYADQYSNPSNPLAHEDGTGPEIIAQTGGRVTHFVAGLGTSGTVMGTGRALKRFRPSIQVIGVMPDDGLHGIEGLKHMPSAIVPAIYHADELDAVMTVDTETAYAMARRLASQEGSARRPLLRRRDGGHARPRRDAGRRRGRDNPARQRHALPQHATVRRAG